MHVFQVGAGSGGIVVLDLVARDPRVTRVTLVEPDVYQAHNVHRHLFGPAAVGRPKAELAAEWVRERRPDVAVETLTADLTDPARADTFARLAAECDVGVCAVDNEPAKYAFDALMRAAKKPWTLGEVLSGGIGGWVHRSAPGGPCYGCVASHLQRTVAEQPAGPAPDYSAPGGPVAETTVPASKASIGVIASLHAVVTLDLLASRERKRPEWVGPPVADAPGSPGRGNDFTSLLFTLAAVPGVFDGAFRPYRLKLDRSPGCLVCSAPGPAAGEDLDVAVDQALARLGGH
ncbi:MAG: ThiF family adenylyltransferase [Gemmataceae bacterium]|nr:ThiF family adenylyltransferase [Gemmataceae bacterium]